MHAPGASRPPRTAAGPRCWGSQDGGSHVPLMRRGSVGPAAAGGGHAEEAVRGAQGRSSWSGASQRRGQRRGQRRPRAPRRAPRPHCRSRPVIRRRCGGAPPPCCPLALLLLRCCCAAAAAQPARQAAAHPGACATVSDGLCLRCRRAPGALSHRHPPPPPPPHCPRPHPPWSSTVVQWQAAEGGGTMHAARSKAGGWSAGGSPQGLERGGASCGRLAVSAARPPPRRPHCRFPVSASTHV